MKVLRAHRRKANLLLQLWKGIPGSMKVLSRLAGISGHTGFLELKSGRIGPDNVPDFPENPVLSGFLRILGVFKSKLCFKNTTAIWRQNPFLLKCKVGWMFTLTSVVSKLRPVCDMHVLFISIFIYSIWISMCKLTLKRLLLSVQCANWLFPSSKLAFENTQEKLCIHVFNVTRHSTI